MTPLEAYMQEIDAYNRHHVEVFRLEMDVWKRVMRPTMDAEEFRRQTTAVHAVYVQRIRYPAMAFFAMAEALS